MKRGEWGAKQPSLSLSLHGNYLSRQPEIRLEKAGFGFVRLKEHDWKFEEKAADITGIPRRLEVSFLRG